MRSVLPSTEKQSYRLHGRRQRGRLRPGRAALIRNLLPQLTPDIDITPGALDPATLFADPVGETWLEIGFGSGEHLLWQLAQNPRVGILGCEPFTNGVSTLLAGLADESLGRVRVLMDDARPLIDALAPASISRTFLLFPDPWPKRRHANRRLIQPRWLNSLARILADGAEFRLASDHSSYQSWMLRLLLNHSAFEWDARRPDDFFSRPKDWPSTRYEERADQEGNQSLFFSFRRKPRESTRADA